MDSLLKCIPHLLEQTEIKKSVIRKPQYLSFKKMDEGSRLLSLLQIYDLIIPTKMTEDIYYILYFALVRSLQSKNRVISEKRMNNPVAFAKGHNGCDVGLITGTSGCGKSLAINRCAEIISKNKIIEIRQPHCKIIPFLSIEASPTMSMKGLLLTILNAVDEKLGTNYYRINSKVTVYLDDLMIQTAKVLMLHVAVLIVDEADRFTSNKKSDIVINFVTELINVSQISVLFVGTEETKNFFGKNPYIARRAFGNTFKCFEYNEEYISFLSELFEYQYTKNKAELTSSLARLMYKCSGGLPATIVYLFVEAQKRAIQLNRATLDETTIKYSFNEKMTVYEPFLENQENVFKSHSKHKDLEDTYIKSINSNPQNDLFGVTLKKTGRNADDFITELQKEISVEVIRL